MTPIERNQLNVISAFSAMVQEDMIDHIILNECDYLLMFPDIRDDGASPTPNPVSSFKVHTYLQQVYGVKLQLFMDIWCNQPLKYPIIITNIYRSDNDPPAYKYIPELFINGVYDPTIPFGEMSRVGSGYSPPKNYNTGMDLIHPNNTYILAQWLIKVMYCDTRTTASIRARTKTCTVDPPRRSRPRSQR